MWRHSASHAKRVARCRLRGWAKVDCMGCQALGYAVTHPTGTTKGPPMATARTAQTHDKRVQKIADDAAAKIAADAPIEEEVVVVVEELPPGERTRTQRGSSTDNDEEPTTAM